MFIKNIKDLNIKTVQSGCQSAKVISQENCDYTVMYNKLDAGKSSNEHSHEDCDELYYVINGSGILKLGKEFRHVLSGDIIVIPKGTFHFITNESDTPVEFLTVGFSSEVYDGWNMWLQGVK